MRAKIVLLLVVAALTVIVVASTIAAPAGAVPKKHGSQLDACPHVEEHNTEVLPHLIWCPPV